MVRLLRFEGMTLWAMGIAIEGIQECLQQMVLYVGG